MSVQQLHLTFNKELEGVGVFVLVMDRSTASYTSWAMRIPSTTPTATPTPTGTPTNGVARWVLQALMIFFTLRISLRANIDIPTQQNHSHIFARHVESAKRHLHHFCQNTCLKSVIFPALQAGRAGGDECICSGRRVG